MAENGDDKKILPGTWKDSDRFVPRAFVQPTLTFLRAEAAGGILMLIAAVVAIAWANSPLQDSYFDLFETRIDIGVSAPAEEGDAAALLDDHAEPALADDHADDEIAADGSDDHGASDNHGPGIKIGPLELTHLPHLTVRDWINDALMALFFFVVGLEIKRELVVGELRDPKAAALPALAALGGMVVPAGLYLLFTSGTDGSSGWGIPMATDIAFAVGVLSMVGSRVPVSAKLFLLALAIVDDLGAILVIALFYTDEVFMVWLAVAAVGLLIVYAMQRVHVRATSAYIIVGSVVWVAVLESGVHATIAGVALALMTPVKAWLDPGKFGGRASALVERAKAYIPDESALHEEDHHTLERVQGIMGDLRTLSRESVPPLNRLEHALVPWTSYVIVPIFALANAGVIMTSDMFADVLGDKVLVGVFVGLLFGKLIGVVGFTWVAVKLGIGKMPRGANWSHIIGVGFLAGIGFTVALFVSALSFPLGSALGDSAKVGIFAASFIAGASGFAWLKLTGGKGNDPDPTQEVEAAAHAA